MYNHYFGLSEAPFSIAVNPRYLFMSARHRDALAHLLYGVGAGGGFILLTGEVGTGKTTLNRCLLQQLPDNTDIAIVLNPAMHAMELLAAVCDELGIDYDVENHTLKTLTDSLHRYLLDNHARGRRTVLLIDEAQHLDFEVLEQIRLLTNLETHSEKLLQIILIGQPELAHMLAQPQLRQLNQRITARYNLEPLNLAETGAYIRHRLQVAGMAADREVFPAGVIRGIYRRTRGIPRLINVLCDRILLGVYGRNRTRADGAMLRLAAREVLGATGGRGALRRYWPALPVLLGVLAVPGVAWWLLARDTAGSLGAPTPAALALNPAAGGPSAPASSRPTDSSGPVAAASPESPGAALSQAAQRPEAAQRPWATGATPGEVAARRAAPWLLSAPRAQAVLWALASVQPPPGDTCPQEAYRGVACIAGQAQTWDDLAGFDRPLLLQVITPERFAGSVVLAGIAGRSGWALTGSSAVPVDLAELGAQWTGRYQFLWHPPVGFKRPLARGDEGAVVAQVAALFARLDGQPSALAGRRFNTALQQRVRLFQRRHGLDDDGVVGAQTLLKLNEQLGIDLTAAAARQQVSGAVQAVLQ
ncbi:MAG: AAA family ATPase [Halioglobus sp.]|nr:AAA family ATPase [Halioglobus sp.]